MTNRIKLDIVSDVMCPWCIIGYRRVGQAINELGMNEMVDVEWHPFQLNPDMPENGEEIHAHIERKYGISRADSTQMLAQMTALGAELGFTFDFFDGIKMLNTADLHVLLEYAKENEKQTELKLRLFTAFFSEQKDVSDRQILMQELEVVGLDAKEGITRLDDDIFQMKSRENESYWKRAGISAVPTMIFDQSHSFTGAQSITVYKDALSSCLEKKVAE